MNYEAMTRVEITAGDEMIETLTGRTVREFDSVNGVMRNVIVEKVTTGESKSYRAGTFQGRHTYEVHKIVKIRVRPVDGGRAITRTLCVGSIVNVCPA